MSSAKGRLFSLGLNELSHIAKDNDDAHPAHTQGLQA